MAARYERLGGQSTRLGSFESYSGRTLGAFGATPEDCARLTQNAVMKLQEANMVIASNPTKYQQLMTEYKNAKAQADNICRQVPHTSSSSSTSSTAADNMNAIAALLSPLATAGATVAKAQIESDAQRRLLKQQGGVAPQVVMVPGESSGSNTGLIVGGILAAVAVAAVVIMMNKKA